MYLSVRSYRSITGPPAEIGRRVADGLVPMLKSLPGFHAYYAAVTGDGRGAFSVSLFDIREQALAANERTRAWVVANLRNLLPNPPEVVGGEVLHEVAAPQDGPEGRRYLSVAMFDATVPIERALLAARDVIGPPGAGLPGVLRFCAFRSESHTNRGVAVILSGDGAPEAQERVLSPMVERMGDMLASPPTVAGGEVLVAVTA